METQRMTHGFDSGQLSDRQLQPGSILVNRYAIQEVIGVGGMGSVYRARDLHFPNAVKLVAVKEMINQARDLMVRQTIVQNFEREANMLVTLDHPSIPRIFDYFTHNERSYLVLEYIQGMDMEELLNQSSAFLPEDQVIQWAIELCDVLSFLHEHKPEPVIFRDMKPSNVMINKSNHIVLIDFGIAKNFRGSHRGTMIGTEGYSPPEQYRGEATPQADIYALGATMHHLLSRIDPRLEPPFTFGDRPIRKSNPAISTELEAVVATALQYSPADRFQTAEDFKRALIAAGRKTGILTHIPTAVRSNTEDGPQPRWKFACEDEIRSTAVVHADAVLIGAYDNNLYAVDAAGGRLKWKYPTEGGVATRPVVSSGVILFGSNDGSLYNLDANNGRLNSTFVTGGPVRSSPIISDGHVFFGCDDGFLYAVNIQSNRLFWRYDTGAPVRSSPAVSGEQIYFGNDNGDFYCLNFNGQVRWRAKAKRAVLSSPLVYKDTIFFTSLDSMLTALDSKSGWAVWRYRMGKGSVSSPCAADNYVFAGAADGLIYCLDIGSAREIWRYQTDHQVSGSPIIHKDSLYCGTADGCLYCLEYRTGRLRWKFNTQGAITGSPIVYNDILYVGSADHILYAIAV